MGCPGNSEYDKMQSELAREQTISDKMTRDIIEYNEIATKNFLTEFHNYMFEKLHACKFENEERRFWE